MSSMDPTPTPPTPPAAPAPASAQLADAAPGPGAATAEAALFSVAHVQAALQTWVPALPACETLPLLQAQQRVLAEDLLSPLNLPPHDNSAMDGYAFDGAALAGAATLRLRVLGTALAGRPWSGRVGPGACVRIMTGAVMPEGLDTVVAQERVQADPAGTEIMLATAQVQRGDNRRRCGEDLQQGQLALRAGTRLGPAALGLLASLGQAQVTVRRRLRVAYFSTGDEILGLEQAPRAGAVYDSNRYTVAGLLQRLGCEMLALGVVPDQPLALDAAFRRAAREADVVITSGGVSVGEADHTRAVVQALGEVQFWRVAMRPGRPLAVGRLHPGGAAPAAGALWFGLPGNPVAALVSFLVFVQPALLRCMGAAWPEPLLLRARSQEALRKAPGRTDYLRAWVSRADDGMLQVRSSGAQGAAVLSSLVQANGLIVLPHAQGPVAAGDAVDVWLFDGAF